MSTVRRSVRVIRSVDHGPVISFLPGVVRPVRPAFDAAGFPFVRLSRESVQKYARIRRAREERRKQRKAQRKLRYKQFRLRQLNQLVTRRLLKKK